MTTSLVPKPFCSINAQVAHKAKLLRNTCVNAVSSAPATGDRLIEDAIFAFDPFQARTLPVFESIYRYGREMFS